MEQQKISLDEFDSRTREVLRTVVESYLETGEPVGSRTISQSVGALGSPATIRNVMSDLERLGLLDAPHTSAGRMPTQLGLRLFVDGLLEIGDITEDERKSIGNRLAGTGRNMEDVLTEASSMLSGLSQCASLVMTPKLDSPIKHIEFVATGPSQALVVIVTEDGAVENRVIATPVGLPPSALIEAGNFLNARVQGQTLDQAIARLGHDIEDSRAQLDLLTAKLIEAGFADWGGGSSNDKSLIVRGRSNLLETVEAATDLERVRMLFDDLESKKGVIQLMELAKDSDGVKIFIGSENNLFSLTGSSLITAPYMDSQQKIIGVLGVIGPTRVNYARIIPLVDYTAKVVGEIFSRNR